MVGLASFTHHISFPLIYLCLSPSCQHNNSRWHWQLFPIKHFLQKVRGERKIQSESFIVSHTHYYLFRLNRHNTCQCIFSLNLFELQLHRIGITFTQALFHYTLLWRVLEKTLLLLCLFINNNNSKQSWIYHSTQVVDCSVLLPHPLEALCQILFITPLLFYISFYHILFTYLSHIYMYI